MAKPGDPSPAHAAWQPDVVGLFGMSDRAPTSDEPLSPTEAADLVLKILSDQHDAVCGDPPLSLSALRAQFGELDDPAFMALVRKAAKKNDIYDLCLLAHRFAACLRRRHAEWATDSDLTKTITIGGGAALVIASIGAVPAGPFGVIAIICAGVFTGARGYSAVRRLEAERSEYLAMKELLEKIVGILENGK